MKGALDREVMTQHKMTIMVRDQGFPSNRNFTRVTVNVQDENDHPPQFVSSVMEASVFETSAIGTSVVQLTAIDQDKGSNAEISYSVVSGKKTYIYGILNHLIHYVNIHLFLSVMMFCVVR